MRREQFVGLMVGALLIVGFLSLVPAYYQITNCHYCPNHENCPSYQLIPFAFIKLVEFFNYAGAAITALATIAIATFTWTLKRSTDNLRDATTKGEGTRAQETRILQRAYLSIEPAGISPSHDPSRCHPNIAIRNAGHLPAQKIKWVIDHLTSMDDRFQTPEAKEDKAQGDNVLPPNSIMIQGGPVINIGTGVGDLHKTHNLFLYVWGAVWYEDGFGERRTTKFCHRYNAINLTEIRSLPGMSGVSTVIGHEISASVARYSRYGNDAT